MIELFERDTITLNRASSKGNQIKWKSNQKWYKADFLGYEGLAEYVVAQLLNYSTLDKKEVTLYETEEIVYKHARYTGCFSENFLLKNWQLITLERLYQQVKGISLYKSIYKIQSYEERAKYLVNEIIGLTGLRDFGTYLTKMITIDALFLNEDRHLHNIALLLDENGDFHYCPLFDHGAALLSDTQQDYPLNHNLYDLIQECHSKTICQSFDDQLDTFEMLYGRPVRFYFTRKDVMNIIDNEVNYSKEIKERVFDIVINQKNKYQYLFVNKEEFQ